MRTGGGRRPFFTPVLLSALVFATVLALSGCGIVATFDRTKLDAGLDSGLDAGLDADGGQDALADADAD